MPFERPTLTSLVNDAIADLKSRITGATTSLRRSTLKVLAKVQAGATHLLYGYLSYIADQMFIAKADELGLINHGNEYGLDRKAPTQATGTATATGSNTTVIPIGTELQAADGQVYTTDAGATIVAGSAVLALTSEEASQDANQDASSSLTFVSPIVGVDASATVDTAGIESGTDEENVEDWRERLLARKRQPPHGGAAHDYIAWALEVPGVTRAWSFPSYFGIGTIGVAFVRDDDDSIIPSAAELLAVYDYIVSHEDPATGTTVGVPVTAQPGFYVVGHNDSNIFALKSVDMNLGIFPNTDAVRSAVNDKIDDLLLEFGGAGETVYLSDIYSGVMEAAGIERVRIIAPTADVPATQQQVHASGTVLFTDY